MRATLIRCWSPRIRTNDARGTYRAVLTVQDGSLYLCTAVLTWDDAPAARIGTTNPTPSLAHARRLPSRLMPFPPRTLLTEPLPCADLGALTARGHIPMTSPSPSPPPPPLLGVPRAFART